MNGTAAFLPGHVLDPKKMAIWSSEYMALVENPSGWVKKCQSCSDPDPYNDIYLWDDEDYIRDHCLLEQQGHAHPRHSDPEAITANPSIWVGPPVKT